MREGRREFIQMVILGGAGFAAIGCGGGDDTESKQQPATPSCSTHGGTASSISGNHGHTFAIPASHFSDGLGHEYSILGTAGHDHLVVLTAGQLATILGGGTVSVTSGETNLHTHVIAAVCGTSGGAGGGGGYDPYP